jgi:hypothetical protein
MTLAPTVSALTVNTEYAATVRDIAPDIIDNHKDVMPTMKIMKEHAKEKSLTPDEKFSQNMIIDMVSSWGMGKSHVFEYSRLDPATQQTWGVHKWGASASINLFDKVHYGNSGKSMIDLAEENVLSIRNALTWRANYDLFSPWNDLNTSLEINLYTVLAAKGFRNPPKTTLKYLSNTDRPYSIPMLIRKHVTGHTIGNIHSSNAEWQPFVQDADGYTPTRATTGINIDCVTNDAAATGSLVEFSVDILEDYLSQFQKGGRYKVYCLLPRRHYNYLVGYFRNERRQTDEALRLRADLGIGSAITFDAFDCVFYTDPMNDVMYPYTLWFFDPECMFPVYDSAFAPYVIPWEKISGTTDEGTVAFYNGNNVSPDRVGLGAMHGYKVA